MERRSVLKEMTLDGTFTDKVQVAIDRIKQYEPKEGYYLAFSGGKDSIVIYNLAVKAGVKFDAHYSRTTVDPPEVLPFIKTNYPEVIIENPRKSMFQLIVKKGFPPSRMARYCCAELKEIGGKGRTCIIGIRWEESANRRNRPIYGESTVVKKKYFLSPIIDWSTEDVWQYIKENKMKYLSLYDMGYDRVGCILCPLKSIKGKEADVKRYPKYYNAYLRCFTRMLKKERKNKNPWKTAEEVMHWWIYGSHLDNTKQTELK